MESLPSKDTRELGMISKFSTEAAPYHFVGSGLENVYLVGVEYEVTEDGLQSASIPCLPQLMEAIGRVLAEKSTALSADEVRFLRKRLRMPSKTFAELVGLSSEQYSRIENGAAITPTVERVVRLLYAALTHFPVAESAKVASTVWMAELNHQERIIACRDEKCGWVVLTRAA